MHLTAIVARRARVIFPLSILFALAAVVPGTAHQTASKPAVCNSSAQVQQLATISNTRDANFQCLGVTVQGDALKALRVESHHVAGTGAASADRVKVAEYPVAEIESDQGAVLDGSRGYKAVIVQGRPSAATGNVELVTSYLYDGLTGEYHSCRVMLDRGADAGWHLVNQYNERVSSIVVRTRSIPVLGTIGIANLEGACTPT